MVALRPEIGRKGRKNLSFLTSQTEQKLRFRFSLLYRAAGSQNKG